MRTFTKEQIAELKRVLADSNVRLSIARAPQIVDTYEIEQRYDGTFAIYFGEDHKADCETELEAYLYLEKYFWQCALAALEERAAQ
jgi:hypothetical protein